MKVPAWLVYLLAVIPFWIIASGRATLVQAGWGLLIGLVTMPLSWRIFHLGEGVHAGRLVLGFFSGAVYFVTGFIPAAVRSSVDMALRVIQPVVPMAPGVVAVPLKFRGATDALLVSNHITLTPGTMVIHLDDEAGILYVHAIDARNPDAIRAEVQALHQEALRRIYP